MKIQLDTQNKTIKVEGMIKLCDLIKHLEILLPEGSPFGSYKEYSIDCNTTIQWYGYPVITNPARTWWDDLPKFNQTPYVQGVPNSQPYLHQPATNIYDAGGVSNVTVLSPDTPMTLTESKTEVSHIFNFTLN